MRIRTSTRTFSQLAKTRSFSMAGITLLEILVTLAVAALTASYVFPGLQTLVANNRQTSTINRFVMSVLLARSVAITQRVEAIVCPSFDGVTCSEGNDWSQGWIVIKQTGNSQDPSHANLYELIRTEPPSQGLTMTSNRVRYHFRPRNKRATNGTIIFCVAHATHPKAVIVSYNGRPRTSRWGPDGELVTCEG